MALPSGNHCTYRNINFGRGRQIYITPPGAPNLPWAPPAHNVPPRYWMLGGKFHAYNSHKHFMIFAKYSDVCKISPLDYFAFDRKKSVDPLSKQLLDLG